MLNATCAQKHSKSIPAAAKQSQSHFTRDAPLKGTVYPPRSHARKDQSKPSAIAMAETMQALVVQPGQTAKVTSAPIPKLRPDYVKVKVTAVALNPSTWPLFPPSPIIHPCV